MKLKLTQISTTHSNLINSEGSIFGVYLDKNTGDLYARGKTKNGQQVIFCKTNAFRMSLYLESRISMIELFLMSYDTHFIVQTGTQAEARFIEIETPDKPMLLKDLMLGDCLYHMISRDMRAEDSPESIIAGLPPIIKKSKTEINDDIKVKPSGIRFSRSTHSPVNMVSVESGKINLNEQDYIAANTHLGEEKIYTKTNPMVLWLFCTGRLNINEIFNCYIHDEYIIQRDMHYYRLSYCKDLESSIINLNFGNNTYHSLPDPYKRKDIMKTWKSYASTMINGLGILSAGFRRIIPVELDINCN